VPDALARRSFASDNHAGAHPAVLAALAEANAGHAPSYGEDAWTARALVLFREHFGPEAQAFPLWSGTAANVLALDAVTRPGQAVICSEFAHLHRDEHAAAERIAGVKLLPHAGENGKLTPDDVRRLGAPRHDVHQVQPRVVSVAQATEVGTVYAPEELRALADAAHELGLLLHVDGARLCNAAAALDVPLRALTTDVGADLTSFGGTKNGLLGAEALVLLRAGLAEALPFARMQLGQLASKMRFVSAQLIALLEGDLWLRNARNANAMAARLAAAAAAIDGVNVLLPVEANALIVQLDPAAIARLRETWAGDGGEPFHVWDEALGGARWMCAWDTTPEDVDAFAAAVRAAVTRCAAAEGS